MTSLSQALTDIKKHYDIKEVEKIIVDYGITTSVRFNSENHIYFITITPIPIEKDVRK